MISLDLKQFGLTGVASELSLECSREVARRMIISLKVKVAAEKQSPFIYESYDSWWELFKLQFFPYWLLKWFPPIPMLHEVKVETLYPFLKTQLPADLHGPTVTLMVDNQLIGSFLSGVNECITPDRWNSEILPRLFSEVYCDGLHCPRCHQSILRKEWK